MAEFGGHLNARLALVPVITFLLLSAHNFSLVRICVNCDPVILHVNHPSSFVLRLQPIHMPTLQTAYEIQMGFGIRIRYESPLKTVKRYTDVNDVPYHQRLMKMLNDKGQSPG